MTYENGFETLTTCPLDDGFHMPGEFEEHEGCYMAWPERRDNWRNGARMAQEAFAAVAREISRFEKVTMTVSPEEEARARRMLGEGIDIIVARSDDSWMRDIGPTFVRNSEGEIRGVDWIFNAWGGLNGGLYHPWDDDDRMAETILVRENVKRYRAPFILEGGAIHVDGQGTLITTKECLLNGNRNPDLSQDEIELLLKKYLGVAKIIWIERGVFNDETDGHVDNLLCFSAPGVVLLTWTDDENDPQHEISKDALRILESETDAMGRKLRVIKVHQPSPITITEEESMGVEPVDGTYPRMAGDRLAASYINHFIANGGVIVPVFGDPMDGEALAVLAEAYPGREIVPVYAREILLGGGNVHCITQQVPRRSKLPSGL
jgi:agmatine deiminase